MTHGGEIAFGPGEEFRFIRRLIRRFGSLAVGIGDDAALIHVPRDNMLAMSTDTAVDNVHFRRDWLTLDEIGYRATTAAISDLAAMGANGLGILVALATPPESRENLDALGDGIARAAVSAGVRIFGGDTARSAVLSLTVTAFGNTRDALRRDAARAGHHVYVTGLLGGPGAAVSALTEGEPLPELWRERFANPHARLREARWAAGRGARAAIDISDGLLADAAHVAAASNVHMTLDLDRIPVIQGVDPIAALQSGEEYELLLTSAIPLDCDAFRARFGIPLTGIGSVSDGEPGVVVISQGKQLEIEPRGSDHFRVA
ncbi:MAG TPA: thiamine-phosphate kinase [Gemmatimonadaceae bacterium]|nr:thiamine-phosphate kinase [Gemmatimonadaceae bacterium]